MKSELETFDGLDNRRELMILLQKLGSDEKRKWFLESLLPHSPFFRQGSMVGHCDPVSSYFALVSICNEVGVSINEAAKLLDEEVRKL